MVYLAFKKGGGSLFSRLIRWRTNGRYSHVELVFAFREYTDMISAREPRGVYGERYTRGWLPDSAEWDLVEITHLDASWQLVAHHFAWKLNGQPYDFRSVVRFFFGGTRDANAGRWFCSEYCVAVLQKVGVFKELTAAAISPEDLWIAATARRGGGC